VLAVAGQDFCVIAADTRLSSGYSIMSRDVPKGVVLSDKCVLVSSGMQADRHTLHKYLNARLQTYTFTHKDTMSTQSVAQLLSTTLCGRRFQPYYTFNVVGGIDENGKGACTARFFMLLLIFCGPRVMFLRFRLPRLDLPRLISSPLSESMIDIVFFHPQAACTATTRSAALS
jgi:hypothetical protein